MAADSPRRRLSILAVVGPGILVAATGVGTGDLVTGALAPSRSGLGLAVLWAVVVGAFLKFVLNEGLARWQLVTGETLLEGAVRRMGRPLVYVFAVYLILWSWFVGAALMGACGVTGHAILPIFNADADKFVYGAGHSIVAIFLVRLGGYRLFEKMMGACIGLMFATVIATAIAVQPDWGDVFRGIVPGNVFALRGDSLAWTMALMGGVGGTVTVLCYGYWIREAGRRGPENIGVCRLDLGVGYVMTAAFGLGMVIIGSRIVVAGQGAGFLIKLADELQLQLGGVGPVARWAFLLGAWGALFSSLLGVWQSVPYLFADFVSLIHEQRRKRAGDEPTATPDSTGPARPIDTTSRAYRGYQYALASIPALGMLGGFAQMQKLNAVLGAMFIPMLAIVLLVLNGRAKYVGEHRNRWPTTVVLAAALLFFLLAGGLDAYRKLAG